MKPEALMATAEMVESFMNLRRSIEEKSKWQLPSLLKIDFLQRPNQKFNELNEMPTKIN